MIHMGHFLQSDFVFVEGEDTSTGKGLIGFEPESGRFTSIWTDSRQTRMSVRQSSEKFDGRSIVLYSKSLEAEELRRSRTVTTLAEDGRGAKQPLILKVIVSKIKGLDREMAGRVGLED